MLPPNVLFITCAVALTVWNVVVIWRRSAMQADATTVGNVSTLGPLAVSATAFVGAAAVYLSDQAVWLMSLAAVLFVLSAHVLGRAEGLRLRWLALAPVWAVVSIVLVQVLGS